MPDQLRHRSPEQVFDDHLQLAAEHRFDEGIDRTIAPDCVILERRGIFHGRDRGPRTRTAARRGAARRPDTYTNRLVAGHVAFLEWTTAAARTQVSHGVEWTTARDQVREQLTGG